MSDLWKQDTENLTTEEANYWYGLGRNAARRRETKLLVYNESRKLTEKQYECIIQGYLSERGALDLILTKAAIRKRREIKRAWTDPDFAFLAAVGIDWKKEDLR